MILWFHSLFWRSSRDIYASLLLIQEQTYHLQIRYIFVLCFVYLCVLSLNAVSSVFKELLSFTSVIKYLSRHMF